MVDHKLISSLCDEFYDEFYAVFDQTCSEKTVAEIYETKEFRKIADTIKDAGENLRDDQILTGILREYSARLT